MDGAFKQAHGKFALAVKSVPRVVTTLPNQQAAYLLDVHKLAILADEPC
jgi:hypothetical protein